MKLLLDTHILLWSLSGSEKLPLRMKKALEKNLMIFGYHPLQHGKC